MEDLNVYIDRRLNDLRPDRYDPTVHDWQEPIVNEIAALIPPGAAQQIAADAKVRAREAQATRAVSSLLREIGRTGAAPLGWMDLERRPLALEKERIALGEATPADFREWARIERRRAATDFTTRNESCEGAETIADLIDNVGGRTIHDL